MNPKVESGLFNCGEHSPATKLNFARRNACFPRFNAFSHQGSQRSPPRVSVARHGQQVNRESHTLPPSHQCRKALHSRLHQPTKSCVATSIPKSLSARVLRWQS